MNEILNHPEPDKYETVNELITDTSTQLEWLKNSIIKEPTINSKINHNENIIKNNDYLRKFLYKIDNNPTLNDPAGNYISTFINKIKSYDFIGAMKSLFSYIEELLWPTNLNIKETFWFSNNKEINEFIEWIHHNKDTLTISELNQYQESLQAKINNTKTIKRKIGLTYALSHIIDEISLQQKPDQLWRQKHKSENDIKISRMAQHVQKWDILAINKSEQKIGDKLLTSLSQDDLDTSHVLIITDVNPETGDITVAHSTASKINEKGAGVETNVSLKEYCNQFNHIAIAVLNPPSNNRDIIIHNIQQKDWKWYDNKAAASTAILWQNISHNNNEYNCVELIAESFPETVNKEWRSWTHPSQMMKYLEPKYVTIAGKQIKN